MSGFHIKLALTFAASHYARSEHGIMYVTVTGSGGRIQEVKLTKEYVGLMVHNYVVLCNSSRSEKSPCNRQNAYKHDVTLSLHSVWS